jgi:hypothetical protein
VLRIKYLLATATLIMPTFLAAAAVGFISLRANLAGGFTLINVIFDYMG